MEVRSFVSWSQCYAIVLMWGDECFIIVLNILHSEKSKLCKNSVALK